MPQIENGQGLDVSVPQGQSIAIATVTGTYSATVISGTSAGTVLATASDAGGTFGPYVSGATVRLSAGLNSCVAYEVGDAPVVGDAPPAKYALDPTTGNVTGLVGPSGKPLPSTIVKRQKYPALANLPGLIAFWDFDEPAGDAKVSKAGLGAFALRDAPGSAVARATEGPFSGYSAQFDGIDDWLRLEGGLTDLLNASLFGNQVTVLACIKRSNTTSGFVGGMWQEDDNNPRRQYGLFVDLGLYGGPEKVCGHISKTGGPSEKILTPGEFLPYSRDYSANLTEIENSTWVWVAMTYDGSEIRSYYESRFEPYPSYTEPGAPNGEGITYAKNPYVFTQGLNDSAAVSDFSVGAVRLTAGPGNWFGGLIGGLAIFSGSLSQADVFKFQRAASSTSTPALTYRFSGVGSSGVSNSLATFAMQTYLGTSGTDVSNVDVPTGGFRQTNQSGQRYLTRDIASIGPCLFTDSQQFSVPYSELIKLTLNTNNSNTSDVLKFCIRVGQQWYASDQSFTQTVAAVSATDWTNMEVKTLNISDATAWRALTLVPNTSLALGNIASLPNGAVVDAFGLFSPSTPAGNMRVRNLSVFAPIP